jgi:predicted DNA-binding transcriptional regulator YafY
MKLLTAQKKLPSLLPASERHEFCFMSAKDEKTEMEKLDAIRKAIKATGDQSVQVKAAYDNITQRITNIVKGIK